MKTLLLTLFIIWIYVPHNLQHQTDASTFNHYIHTLNQIPLTFIHSFKEKRFPNLSKNYDKKSFERYKHSWTIRPFGILINDSKHIVTIDLSIGDLGEVPFLMSFDKQGNKIDSLGPYKLSGEDEGYKAVETLIITSKKDIIVKDIITRYKNNSKANDVDKSPEISMGITHYLIAPNGKFIQGKRKVIKRN